MGFLALILLALSTLAMPVGAVTTSYVPGMVLGGTVPAFVSGAPEGAIVSLSLGTSSAERESTGEDLTVEVAGVLPGLYAWELGITEDGVTTTTYGHVLVDDRLDVVQAALLALRSDEGALSALANLTTALAEMQHELLDGQNRTDAQVAGLPDDVALNVTSALEEFAQQLSNGSFLGAADPPATPAAVAAPVEQPAPAVPLALWPVAVAAGLALAAVAAVATSWLQGRRHRRETMVLLLALAARSGITPQSQEFQLALQALEGGKPAKADAPTPAPAAADGV
ncbi:MAG: hypothetical protein ACYC2H_09160 [Thermoplasmatota archaeon]